MPIGRVTQERGESLYPTLGNKALNNLCGPQNLRAGRRKRGGKGRSQIGIAVLDIKHVESSAQNNTFINQLGDDLLHISTVIAYVRNTPGWYRSFSTKGIMYLGCLGATGDLGETRWRVVGPLNVV